MELNQTAKASDQSTELISNHDTPTVFKRSHYYDPIDYSLRQPHGRSRRWGDISPAAQKDVIAIILEEAARQKLPVGETALLLATARIESGFNPDAAATTTSAAGLGQFIDNTAKAFGLIGDKRFSLRHNIRAMILHIRDNLRTACDKYGAQSYDQAVSYAYALYHDGPSLKYGGLEIAKANVVPWARRYAAGLLR